MPTITTYPVQGRTDWYIAHAERYSPIYGGLRRFVAFADTRQQAFMECVYQLAAAGNYPI